MNQLLTRLSRRFAAPSCPRAGRRSRTPEAEDHGKPGEGGSFGCGWFDSSHDLHRGLTVHEHAGLEALAPDEQLAAWLALEGSASRYASRPL